MVGWRMRLLGAVLAVAAFAVVAPARSETVDLRLSHFLPPVHGLHKDFMEPWARELEKRSGGTVRVSIFPGTAALGNVAQQYDQVLAGVTDISHGLVGIPRGRFPRTTLMDLPFLFSSADQATRSLWALYKDGLLGDEFKEVKVLALHCHNPGLFHTRDVAVRTMDDLKGLRMRTPSPAISAMLAYLGATPVGMPPGQVYEALQRGTLDGAAFPWDPVNSFKLAEVLNFHLDARVYTTCFYFVMNRRSYQHLPEAARQAIDDISGDNLIPKFGPWWDAWDAPGLKAAVDRGNTILELDDAERAQWREALQPMIEQWLDERTADGIDDARDIYRAARHYAEEFAH
ncbi:MAG: C4-dicarboxylate ABC transporter [Rhodospirillaceae bacterium]|nr:C4-dicarboxylate ABC transporter [Rhodospirillaceae bacterium]